MNGLERPGVNVFDLFGFWASVTLHTFLLAGIPLAVTAVLLVLFIAHVVQDSEVSGKFDDFIMEKKRDGYFVFLGRIKIHGELVGLWVVGSGVWWVIISTMALVQDENLVHVVSDFSEFSSKVVGWIAIIMLSYMCLLYSCRFVYKLSIKVNELVSKLESKE